MNKYQEFIDSLLKDGTTKMEDIAAEFSNALNECEKRVKEQEDKKKNDIRKQTFLVDLAEKYNDVFNKMVVNYAEVDPAVIVGLLTVVVANHHPEWDLTRCKVFNDSMVDITRDTERFCGTDIFNDPVKSFMDLLFSPKQEKKDKNTSDKDVITRFLDTL